MNRIELTAAAEEDLQVIWEYVAQHNAEAAHKLIEEIVGKFASLRDHPYSGRQRDDLLVNLRSALVRNYVIFYQPFADRVEIIRVLHSARDIENLFRRFFDSL